MAFLKFYCEVLFVFAVCLCSSYADDEECPPDSGQMCLNGGRCLDGRCACPQTATQKLSGLLCQFMFGVAICQDCYGPGDDDAGYCSVVSGCYNATNACAQTCANGYCKFGINCHCFHGFYLDGATCKPCSECSGVCLYQDVSNYRGHHCVACPSCPGGDMCFANATNHLVCPPNPCAPNPCNNGGECMALSEVRYECRCPVGFKGRHCDFCD